MPLTTLDPVAALVSIDLQKGIISFPTVHPAQEIVSHTAQLARAFRQRGLPVVLVNVTGAAPGRTDAGRHPLPSAPDWAELAPQLDPSPPTYASPNSAGEPSSAPRSTSSFATAAPPRSFSPEWPPASA